MRTSPLPCSAAHVAVAAVAVAASGFVAACAPPQVDCTRYTATPADASIVIVAPAASDALDDLIDTLVDRPHDVIGSPALGLDTASAVVVVASPDDTGSLTVHGEVNVAAAEPPDDDAQQADYLADTCLRAAAQSVPNTHPANVLRSLQAAESQGRRWGDDTAIVALGLGASGGDGLDLATADLGTPQMRAAVLDELAKHDLLPQLDAATAVQFVAPAERTASGIAAAGIERFATDLCARLHATPCGAPTALERQATQ